MCVAGSALFYFERGCDNRPCTGAVDWPRHTWTAAGRGKKKNKKTLESPMAASVEEVKRLFLSDKESRLCD